MTAALNRELPPPLRAVPASAPFQFQMHARYSPEQFTVVAAAAVADRRLHPWWWPALPSGPTARPWTDGAGGGRSGARRAVIPPVAAGPAGLGRGKRIRSNLRMA